MSKESVTQEIKTLFGKIVVYEEVIAAVAGFAAEECYGLVGMASRKISDGVARLLNRENIARGIQVSIREEELVIELNVIVGYGVKISEVAGNVIERVRYCVESMTGLKVALVNVKVQSVRYAE
ncbi:MAG: Asp23/Gls24 family envelope stress response protein [Peptococcaceae bacterium]|nr:Asp23/Gls24 family envelope stress response protein [Peptococcaceae bacterium]